MLEVATGERAAYSPVDEKNITIGLYPIVRPLFQYTNGVPTGKLKSFLQFSLSEDGQQIVAENGYYPIGEKYKQQNQEILQ